MLVEDCQDSFAVGEDGVLHAYTPDPRDFDDACPEITCHQVWNVHALDGTWEVVDPPEEDLRDG